MTQEMCGILVVCALSSFSAGKLVKNEELMVDNPSTDNDMCMYAIKKVKVLIFSFYNLVY